ncbi:hypothetical protein V5799_016299 [Amblyomma americanum]|uniref:Uncharacterized protein n=1 Tax=Amblyomma americanum TaxID=6943 RepID=A0AAQ4F5H9_AMBAM
MLVGPASRRQSTRAVAPRFRRYSSGRLRNAGAGFPWLFEKEKIAVISVYCIALRQSVHSRPSPASPEDHQDGTAP